MIFDRIAILKAISDGRIVFNASDEELEELISVNSIDFRLGKKLYKLQEAPMQGHGTLLNPYVDNTFDKGYSLDTRGCAFSGAFICESLYQAHWEEIFPEDITEDVVERLHLPKKYLGLQFFLLEPDTRYIGVTYEEFGSVASSGIVPEVRAKSTTGRNMLTVALCAGMGDEGYCGKWALEIRTVGCYVPLIVGTPIGQVVFHQTVSGAGTGIDYKLKAGAYQKAGEPAKLIPKPMKVVRGKDV